MCEGGVWGGAFSLASAALAALGVGRGLDLGRVVGAAVDAERLPLCGARSAGVGTEKFALALLWITNDIAQCPQQTRNHDDKRKIGHWFKFEIYRGLGLACE
jgi:hypothetical protein